MLHCIALLYPVPKIRKGISERARRRGPTTTRSRDEKRVEGAQANPISLGPVVPVALPPTHSGAITASRFPLCSGLLRGTEARYAHVPPRLRVVSCWREGSPNSRGGASLTTNLQPFCDGIPKERGGDPACKGSRCTGYASGGRHDRKASTVSFGKRLRLHVVYSTRRGDDLHFDGLS